MRKKLPISPGKTYLGTAAAPFNFTIAEVNSNEFTNQSESKDGSVLSSSMTRALQEESKNGSMQVPRIPAAHI